MPERWQQELKKLGAVEPSDDVWRRAEQGPREPAGPSLPPRRQRIVAGVVAMVVFLAAGGFAWRALRPSSGRTVGSDHAAGPTVQVTFKGFKLGATDGPSTFTATMKVGDRTVMGTNTGTGSQFRSRNPFDIAPGPDLLPLAFVPVMRGSLLGVIGDAESVDAELLPPQSPPIPPIVSFGRLNGPIVLDQPAGRYLLSLTGHWADGSATFSFPIDLEDHQIGVTIGSTRGTVAFSFVAGTLAPDVTMRYYGHDQDGVRTYYTWCDDSGRCVEGFADFATYPPSVPYLKITAGTPLLLSGDATAVEGIFRRDGHGDQGESYLDQGSIPDTPGRYVLEIHAVFDRGEATFFLGIEATPRVHW